jgi:hypothetical protein
MKLVTVSWNTGIVVLCRSWHPKRVLGLAVIGKSQLLYDYVGLLRAAEESSNIMHDDDHQSLSSINDVLLMFMG